MNRNYLLFALLSASVSVQAGKKGKKELTPKQVELRAALHAAIQHKNERRQELQAAVASVTKQGGGNRSVIVCEHGVIKTERLS